MTAVVVAEDDRRGDRPEPGLTGASFLDSLVVRLHADLGADPAEIRERAVAALATFADARVQLFVPILVEKRLRETYRGEGAAP